MNHYPDYSVFSCNSFMEILIHAEDKYCNETMFWHYKERITYGEFVKKVRSVAGALKKYDRQYILIDLSSVKKFAVAYFATVITNNIAVLHNTAMKTLEEPFQKLQYACVLDNAFWDDMASQTEGKGDCVFFNDITKPTETCTILCSSGTSSVPKGVCLSQKNICSCTENGIRKVLYPEGAKYLSVLPLSHAFGLVADLMGCIYSGGTLCVMDSPLQLYSGLLYYEPDKLNVPPSVAARLLTMIRVADDPKSVVGINLKTILCAGAPIDVSICRELREYGIQVLLAYGQSECSPCISMNRNEDYKDGSCGLILEHLSVKIADDQEILVKGDGVMNGYLNDSEATIEVLKDGWLHTRDLGYVDDEGFLFVIGRKNNLAIFSDGTKYPIETLELRLNEIDGVEESLACMQDDMWNIKICSYKNNTNNISETIKKRTVTLTGHVVRELTFQKEFFPRNRIGKIIRN